MSIVNSFANDDDILSMKCRHLISIHVTRDGGSVLTVKGGGLFTKSY